MADATTDGGVVAELERLAQCVEAAAARLSRLQRERDEIARERDELLRDRQGLWRVAGVSDREELVQLIRQARELVEENRALLRERREVSGRLAALIEKVDLLPGEP